MKRRDFLYTLGGTLLSADLLTAAEHAGKVRTVSLIHTTDLHGHILPTNTYEGLTDVGGLARCATVIRQWRQENPRHLLLDIGDLYQGTDVGRRTSGQVMVKLLNKLNYDAWVLGNHDFDWGRNIVEDALKHAAMPVLANNVKFSGKLAGEHEGGKENPLTRLAPHIIREVAGFKIGIVGIVTPGLDAWLNPKILRDIESLDPIEPTRRAIDALKEAGVNAIVLCGHMGFKAPTFFKDDHANRIMEITKAAKEADVFIGAHTHKDIPSSWVNGTPYTQANYHGIHLGRVDLAFHVESGKLINVRQFTVLMDERYALDPVVLSTVKDDLEISAKELAKPVGEVTDTLSAKSKPGEPSDLLLLLGKAIKETLATHSKVEVDGVLHGSFSDEDMPPGPKTVDDIWKFMPYENFLVTVDLTPEEITAVLGEALADDRVGRNLMGFVVRADKNGTVNEVLDRSGRPLDPKKRYKIALNSYDAQSGGQRMMKVKEIVASPASAATFHETETRDAVIEYFLRHKTISQKLVNS